MRTVFLLVAASLLVPAASAQVPGPGDGVMIAVLDTGIDSAHSDLAGRVDRVSFYQPTIPPIPGLPDPGQVQPDPDGHGTASASIAAGATLGIAKGARLLDLQVSGQYTRGAIDPTAEAAAGRAMDHLLDNHGGEGSAGARIALLSFAGNISAPGASTLEAQAHKLWDAGVLVIVPAGGRSALHASPYVVTVGDKDGSCGASAANPTSVHKPDVAAPARDVPAAGVSNPTAPAPQTLATGTHAAAAAVAGTAAWMWQVRPDLPVDALAAILRGTASGDQSAPDRCTGFGAIDVPRAVAAADGWTDLVSPGGKQAAGVPTSVLLLGLVGATVAFAARRRAA